jgi:hypothetical protein
MTDFRSDTRKLELARIENETVISERQGILVISKSVFQALNPLDQIAARALEKCGSVQIVDDIVMEQAG